MADTIKIEFISHMQQRYDTIGDWQWVPTKHDPLSPDLVIRVTSMWDWRSNVLVAVHELVEAVLCQHAGVSGEMVDAWDITGPGKDMDEPGDHPKCPYYLMHADAEEIERKLCHRLGLSWEQHERNCEYAQNRRSLPKHLHGDVSAASAASIGSSGRDVCDPVRGDHGLIEWPARDGHPRPDEGIAE